MTLTLTAPDSSNNPEIMQLSGSRNAVVCGRKAAAEHNLQLIGAGLLKSSSDTAESHGITIESVDEMLRCEF